MKALVSALALFLISNWGFSVSSLQAKAYSGSEATFAGGCFWCVEADFEKVPGVTEVISGYSGGTKANPTYKEVSSGKTDYLEAVRVIFDPKKVSYSTLLEVFWKHIDPTDPGGQFVDRGAQYRSAVFYQDKEQKILAESSKEALANSGVFDQPIVTEIRPIQSFYPAEEYHQDYHKNHWIRYRFYRYNSGRNQFLKKVWNEKEFNLAETDSQKNGKEWAKPDDATLHSILTELQYGVTQEDATEPPFHNEYWDNKKEALR